LTRGSAMRVRVRVFGDLSKILGKELAVDLPLGSTVGDLLDELGERHAELRGDVAEGEGGNRSNVVVLLGGLNTQFLRGRETILNEGDVVSLLPPAGGG